MSANRCQNFRLRGIPCECETRADVRELVKRILSIEAGTSVVVHSLAISPIEQISKVATPSFHALPDCLSDCSRNEWVFSLPADETLCENSFSRRKSLVFDTHFSGFTSLQHTKDVDYHVDVIALSSLGGHAFDSFKRKTWESTQSRPIVFIGHGLGGLVIKEAIVKLNEKMDEEDALILNFTSGFLFFSVPRQGMAIESLVPLVKDYPNRSLLESLNKNSALLQRLEKDFRNAFGTKHPKVLFDVSSATCGSNHQYPINRNHSEMVKYNSQYDDLYTRVRIALKPLMRRSQSKSVDVTSEQLSDENKECLMSLFFFREQEHRHKEIHSEKDTCEWLFEDSQWNPGAGKSVLMKFAVTIIDRRKSGELVKTLLGVFRALLNSVLMSFLGYLSQLTKRFNDQERRFGSCHENRWSWTEEELQEFMSEILTKGTKNRPGVIFVDAIDECGQRHAKCLLEYFKSLMNIIEREEAQVKICFSSRHFPILGLDTISTISVEERNDKDIVIQQRLKQIQPEAKRQQMEKEILSKAQGGFQWVVLITTIWVLFAERPLSAQELREALATYKDMTFTTVSELRSHDSWSDTLDDFEKHVRQVSRGLVEFRTREIWEQYEPGGEDSDREVQFVHQSVADYILGKFLNHVRLGDATQSQIGTGHVEISRSCLKYLTLREVSEGAQLSRGPFPARFPLVLYIVRSVFYHILQVEREGISQHDLLQLIQLDRKPEFLKKIASIWKVMDPNNAHAPMGWPFIEATLLHVLVALGLKGAFDALMQKDDVEIDGKDSYGNTPLLLAIGGNHQNMALALLNRSMEWQLRHGAIDQDITQEKDTGHRSNPFLDINAENNDGDTPLALALEMNAEEVVLKLIEAGADLNFPGPQTELVFYAIYKRNKTLLSKLLAKNVKIDGAVYFALEELSYKDCDDVLEDFLSELLKAGANTGKLQEVDNFEHEGEDEDEVMLDDEDESDDEAMRDDDVESDGEAIILASRRGQTAIVNLLLSHDALATARNKHGRFPLLVAVENGHEPIVKLLLENGRARLLIDKGADINLSDKDGLTPLLSAFRNDHRAVLSLLLHKGARF
ncbi:ankyrin repeat protein [Trichoderma chlorosporum]